jgi:hypothetical protein
MANAPGRPPWKGSSLFCPHVMPQSQQEKSAERRLVTAMASRRSIGVVLIAALLAWSVNQRVLTCSGDQSRAAVVAPAGASPAPKPEPSPSRHNCCPFEKMHSWQPQPLSHPNCPLHAKLAVNCCSIAANAALSMPFQKAPTVERKKVLASAMLRHTPAIATPSLLCNLFRFSYRKAPAVHPPYCDFATYVLPSYPE